MKLERAGDGDRQVAGRNPRSRVRRHRLRSARAQRTKFPEPAKLELLEYAAAHANDQQADAVVTNTLDHIAAGGIVDHLAGGFHRYSTDRRWRVPHFERVLRSGPAGRVLRPGLSPHGQAGISPYGRASLRLRAQGDVDPAGGFISSLDAQTDGVEGVYYVWTPAEVDAVLGAGRSPLSPGLRPRRAQRVRAGIRAAADGDQRKAGPRSARDAGSDRSATRRCAGAACWRIDKHAGPSRGTIKCLPPGTG